jgi:hypothetical protein
MVSGGVENGRELFVSRAVYGNGLFPGKTWAGLGGCFVAVAGEPLVTPYQVLVKPPLVSEEFVYRFATHAELNADGTLWGLAVQGGFSPSSSPDYLLCTRDLWVNGTYVGRHPGRFIGGPPSLAGTLCVVTWGGQSYYETDNWSLLIYERAP